MTFSSPLRAPSSCKADAVVPPVPTNSGSGGRYTVVAIILHWVMALGILALAAIGLVMVHSNIPLQRKFELYQLHKSVRVKILLAALLRMGWRLMHKPPELPAHMPSLERAADAVQLITP
jgi:cytochrome b561